AARDHDFTERDGKDALVVLEVQGDFGDVHRAARRRSLEDDLLNLPAARRAGDPWKMPPSSSPPRSARALCSPSTQRTASETLDFPQPFGPTMAVTPGWKFRDVLSAKDLKPRTVKFFRYMICDRVYPNTI